MNENMNSPEISGDYESSPTCMYGTCGQGITPITNNPKAGQQPAPAPLQTLPLFLQPQNTMPQQPMQVAPMYQQPLMQTPLATVPAMPQMAGQTTTGPVFTNYEQLAILSDNIPITTETVQYLNGFLRTQLGRRVKVEFLIGTNSFVDKEGILLGVGVNYILLNETDTDDLTACDFYNIKFIRFYY